ncbi:MAG: hypothetical protein ACYDCH_10240 [Gaiellaceae bacterium]
MKLYSPKESAMPESDLESVREALRRLSVPPESPQFFEELQERMREHDRAAARRWRGTTVALAAVAVSAIAAAAVMAATFSGGSTVERTVSCATKSAAVEISASATNPISRAAGAGISAGLTNTAKSSLLAFDTNHGGFVLSAAACRTVKETVPLARSGLPSTGVYRAGNYASLDGHCTAPARVLLHVRLHLDSAGKPQNATFAVWQAAKQTKLAKPIAFIQWSPQRTLTYLSPRCVTH